MNGLMRWLPFAIALLAFVASAVVYDAMPPTMATHWDAFGNANGFMDKGTALFFLPVLMLVLAGLFLLIPRIDPLKANIKKFEGAYWAFVTVMMLFMLALHLVSFAINAGYAIDIRYVLLPGLAAVFYCSGWLMERAQPNWFVGIRTPWTMSSPKVWKKTHELGASLFKATAILCMVFIFWIDLAVFVVIGMALAPTVALVVYSFLEFQKEKRLKG